MPVRAFISPPYSLVNENCNGSGTAQPKRYLEPEIEFGYHEVEAEIRCQLRLEARAHKQREYWTEQHKITNVQEEYLDEADRLPSHITLFQG